MISVPDHTHVNPEGGGARRAAALRRAVRAQWWPAVRTHEAIAQVIAENLPDAIVVGDSTEPIYAMNQCLRPRRPRSYFNSGTGYGTLGYGLPAGIGAKIAAPGRPVVVITGDGGLMFSISELATAKQEKISIVILLWNNGG